MNWYNIKTDETEDFSKDKYSIDKPNDWQVLIENDNNPLFNQFKSNIPSIKNSYEWLFDNIESL